MATHTEVVPGEVPQLLPIIDELVSEAQTASEYPAIFDESHLPATIHEVIARTGWPQNTPAQRRRSEVLACFQVGVYMQDHQLV